MNMIADRVAVVTGAGQGIGAAIADRFEKEGGLVYACDITFPQRVNSSPGATHLDVTNLGQWQELAAFLKQRHGHVDILVNNAGSVGSYATITDVSLDDWDAVIKLNQTSVFYGMRTMIPLMNERRSGSIINISSIWGLLGANGVAAYQASKGAVSMMTRNGACSYASSGIRVNSIHPGLIWTPMTEAQDPEISNELVSKTPLGRAGTPQEVAALALFLASDESAFITGAQIPVDGGFTAV